MQTFGQTWVTLVDFKLMCGQLDIWGQGGLQSYIHYVFCTLSNFLKLFTWYDMQTRTYTCMYHKCHVTTEYQSYLFFGIEFGREIQNTLLK